VPDRPWRVCRKFGCNALTQRKSGFCELHEAWWEEQQAARLKARKARLDARRGSAAARGYGRKWREAREEYLRDHPLCVLCLDRGIVRPALVVDHIIPHRGDVGLFWDEDNWQALCVACHTAKTARGE
jgi:5-methylcytosine-specific restriction protein A